MRKEIILILTTIVVCFGINYLRAPKSTMRTCDIIKEHGIFLGAKVTEHECYVPENAMCQIKDTRIGNSIRCFTTEHK